MYRIFLFLYYFTKEELAVVACMPNVLQSPFNFTYLSYYVWMIDNDGNGKD